LLLPRTINHGGFFELSVEGEDCQIEASIGWRGNHLPTLPITWRSENQDLLGDGHTPTRNRPVRLGSRLELETGTLSDVVLSGSDAQWKIEGNKGRLKLAMCVSIRGGMEAEAPDAARMADLKQLAHGRSDGSLRQANEELWKKIWSRGFDVSVLPIEYRRIALAQHYYLLASFDNAPWPNGPQGVSGNNWRGQQLWDNDLWAFRALLPLWPEFAESVLGARLRQLPEARQAAAKRGREGASLVFVDEEGIDHNPEQSIYREELHLSAWPAFAVWDFWLATGDKARLEHYWPILHDTANFFVSRCNSDPEGVWHLQGVVPPDEYVCEHGKGLCDDSVTTNLVVRAVLRATNQAASILDKPLDPRWKTVGENLCILGPDENGIVPEFKGYEGETIKQADVALAFYPLGLALPEKLVRQNLAYYRHRCDPYGPLMSRQIDACVLMRLGDRDEGLRLLFEGYARHLRGPFLIPTEGPHNNVVGFITGCGGLIQALVFGFTDYRQPGDDSALIPRLGDDW
jgi:trehalose/maltose hydrolase-like predicted phosphorylase